uniref:RING-type E3 ubiquitin transferase n=1 Tax=Arcella intermedia TaxID=1963864 RepID=A0A6B2L1H0_9EUKA
MNFATYCVGSLGLTCFILLKSFYQYHQFYPAMVYLYQSKACNAVLANFLIMLAFIFFKLTKSILLGPIRDTEVESLQEKLWFSISDSLLAMTVFQDDFTLYFLFWFASLILSKSLHWLLSERIDYMSRSASPAALPQLRLLFLLVLLVASDLSLASYTNKLSTPEPNMMLLFVFEYVILSVTSLSLWVKYGLNLYDIHSEAPWESRGVVSMYLDLLVDFVQMLVYVSFFVSITKYYGLPLHLIRQIYFTFTSLWKRITSVMKYRELTRDLDVRFPVATQEQLNDERVDVCIVCREVLESGRVLPCGHILHRKCLLSWLERSQFCPLCREPVGGNEDQQQQQQNPFFQANNGPIQQQQLPPMPPMPPEEGAPYYPPPPYSPSFSPSPSPSMDSIENQLIMLQEQVVFMNDQILGLIEDVQRIRNQPNQFPPSPSLPIPNDLAPPPSDPNGFLPDPLTSPTPRTTTTTTTRPSGPPAFPPFPPYPPDGAADIPFPNVPLPDDDDDEEPSHTPTHSDPKEELRKRRVLHFSGERPTRPLHPN